MFCHAVCQLCPVYLFYLSFSGHNVFEDDIPGVLNLTYTVIIGKNVNETDIDGAKLFEQLQFFV